MEKYGYRFSFGPWNIADGADPFGPPCVRPVVRRQLLCREMGFDAVQFR
jgi:xylose isomerase